VGQTRVRTRGTQTGKRRGTAGEEEELGRKEVANERRHDRHRSLVRQCRSRGKIPWQRKSTTAGPNAPLNLGHASQQRHLPNPNNTAPNPPRLDSNLLANRPSSPRHRSPAAKRQHPPLPFQQLPLLRRHLLRLQPSSSTKRKRRTLPISRRRRWRSCSTSRGRGARWQLS
jgi:hypothetical protein